LIPFLGILAFSHASYPIAQVPGGILLPHMQSQSQANAIDHAAVLIERGAMNAKMTEMPIRRRIQAIILINALIPNQKRLLPLTERESNLPVRIINMVEIDTLQMSMRNATTKKDGKLSTSQVTLNAQHALIQGHP
jgi:hypothetical protein